MKLAQIGCVVLSAALLAGAGYVALERRAHNNQIAALNNAIAERDRTIEVRQGLYEKATLQLRDLEAVLVEKDGQIRSLKEELDRKDQELVAATNLAIKWKRDYEALVNATQEPVTPVNPGDPERVKVSFEKDFGPIKVSGYTLTDPAEAYINLHQQRPLRLTVAIAQDSNGLWSTYTTSSEENIAAEIVVSAVNPYFNERKWYEKLVLSLTVAAGGDGDAVGGVGIGVDFSRFTASVMGYTSTRGFPTPMVGALLQWRPFFR